MSEFVNYNKRSIKLPPGCKDLIDLLDPNRRRQPPNELGRDLGCTGSSGISVLGNLADMGKHIQTLFESQALRFVLGLQPSGNELSLAVMKTPGENISALITLKSGTQQESALHKFCTLKGLKFPKEDVDTGPGVQFHGVPEFRLLGISPMPGDPAKLVRLLLDLFHEVCRLNDNSQLHYLHCERLKAD